MITGKVCSKVLKVTVFNASKRKALSPGSHDGTTPKSGREAWYIGPVECADATRNDGSPFQSHPVSVFDIPGIVQPPKIK